MDRITTSFIKEFSSNFELNKLEISEQFEHFVNYCVILNESAAMDIGLEDMHTGLAAQGIDGIAIDINGRLINSIQEIDDLIRINKVLNVKFIFTQAKTSAEFDNTLIGNFFNFTYLFFKGENDIFTTDEMKKFIELKDYIYENSMYMHEKNPSLVLYYVSTGTWDNENLTLKTVIKGNKSNLEGLNLFSNVEFIPCGAKEIQNYYRKTKNDLSATFNFEKKVTMFSNDDGGVGYYGVLPFKEFSKIICEENGKLKPVFEDNIRDFLGVNNDVNIAIEQTLRSNNINAFSMLNNGVTVVADSAPSTGDKITINNYQIVNGCQTSHVLYLNREADGIDNLMIPLRIITTTNEELKNSITKATNSQTEIKKEQLEALSTFQKKLEEYYKTFEVENERLYYERRTGQFRNNDVPNSRIVSIPMQIKTVSAMFLDNPHGVSGQYGTIAKNVGKKIFKETDKPIIYYVSSLALYRFESFVKAKLIKKEHRRARYHVMMLFKYVISGEQPKYNNSNKMEYYCEKIRKVLNDEEKCQLIFNKIIEFILSKDTEIDLSDRKLFEKKETTDYLLNQKSNLKAYIQEVL